ncbi:hypothetical protein RJ639_045043 [Escallonia herrerae]|uniref:Gnk2-homologous domain-containing protein n=1 Tax=Escallonia herrerae TaxID=1293975 RepID=A0AA89B999_9ASTE|nr:hypothetical protein RJ639_045043 [Escallonia herrerae]
MDYPGLSLCFLIILNFLVSLTTPQPTLAYYRCSTGGNYTTSSTYAVNLKTLLSSVSKSSDLNSDGFFTASIGQNPDQVYAIGLCRGDQTVTSCSSCLNDSSQAITQHKGAIGGYDNCMLKFNNSNILSSVDNTYVYVGCNGNNATNLAQFNNVLGNLLFSLRGRAAAAATRKYAAGEANYTNFSKIYGLEQCTPDISEADCGRCLDMARIDMTYFCGGKVGATSVRYSCVLRFELYQFYEPTAHAPPPPRGTGSPPPFSTDTPGTLHAIYFRVYTVSATVIKLVTRLGLTAIRTIHGNEVLESLGGGGNKFRTIIAIVIPTGSAVLIVFLICFFLKLRERKQNMSMRAAVYEILKMEEL